VRTFNNLQPRSTLKPGEKKKFVFSFKTEKVGMFNEEWELLTEPALLGSLPQLSLSGIGEAEDELVQARADFEAMFTAEMNTMASKFTDDGISEIQMESKTPTKVLPDIEDPLVFAPLFEERNRDRVLYYSKPVMEGFFDLLDDLDHLHRRATGNSLFKTFTWSTKVSEIETMIKAISNPLSQQTMFEKYNRLLARAKKIPNHRAHSYNVIKAAITNVVQ
jgi:hypothetical protein